MLMLTSSEIMPDELKCVTFCLHVVHAQTRQKTRHTSLQVNYKSRKSSCERSRYMKSGAHEKIVGNLIFFHGLLMKCMHQSSLVCYSLKDRSGDMLT